MSKRVCGEVECHDLHGKREIATAQLSDRVMEQRPRGESQPVSEGCRLKKGSTNTVNEDDLDIHP
jgi:hypothetical protein